MSNLVYKSEGNPFVKHIFTADPSAHVFNGRMYVYTSHDEPDADDFYMLDWHVFSSDDLVTWEDHGPILSLNDLSWATQKAWAPDAIERNGKYYLYIPTDQSMIGVAVSDSPTGPFVDPVGKPLVDNKVDPFAGPEPIDPAVFIDDDGQAYMYFGCRHARVVKLNEDMVSTDGPLLEVKLTGNEGMDKENQAGFYGEGPWMFKRGGRYYFVFSNGWAPDCTMVYAIGEDPLGPYDFKGPVMEPIDCFTSHGSVVEYKGRWFVFYHTMWLSGFDHRRSVCVDELFFNDDGTIRVVTASKEGPGPVG